MGKLKRLIYLAEFALCAVIAYRGDFMTATLLFFALAGITYILTPETN